MVSEKEAQMATTVKDKNEITISWIFDAPREKVWRAWTNPKEVKKWWGPKDFTAPEIKIDLKIGGKYLYSMRGAGFDGVVKDFWNVGKFTEIVPMKRIVSTLSFADEKGNPVPATHYGMPGNWPMEVMAIVTFEEVEDGKTKLTVREVGIPSEMGEPARMGWEQQFDKLAETLK
jgi:uncharacterized protein YndB with AHSA1/START domain